MYDKYGHAGVKGMHHDFDSGFFGGGGFSDIFSGFEDLFEGFFGGSSGGRSRSRQQRGSDLRYDLELTLEEAVYGCTKTIEVSREEVCQTCSGKGSENSGDIGTCSTCGGSGQVTMSQGFLRISQTCPTCRGKGTVIKNPCKSCRGKGTQTKMRQITVKVPAGVENSTRLKMSGEGDKGANGAIPGDLYIVMFVLPHKYFERHGNHLVCQVPITYTQAVLGGEIRVKTLDNKTVKVKIPSGTKHADQLRIKGEGVKPVNSYGKGDMIIVVELDIPTSLSSKEKNLLKEFAKLHKDNSEPEPINLDKKRRY